MEEVRQNIIILFDADCYLCSNFQQYLKLKQKVDILYKDIHEHSDYISSLQRQWYDLDKGMIIDIDGRIYQWKDAIAEIEKLVDNQNRFDKFIKLCMSYPWIRTLGYPVAQLIRKILLWFRNFNFIHYIISVVIFLISFFPAKFGYMPERSWVGFATTIGFALSCYIPLWRLYKWRWMITLGIIWLFGYIIESIWVLTCYPYGCFHYSEQLWPKIFGIVPYMLFFTWPPLVFGVWSRIKDIRLSYIYKALLGGIILMGLDLVLDPIAVWMWLWSYPGGWFWFRVPLSNFVWRVISWSISTAMVEYLLGWKWRLIKKRLDYGLLLTMIFFIGYMFRYQIMFYFF